MRLLIIAWTFLGIEGKVCMFFNSIIWMEWNVLGGVLATQTMIACACVAQIKRDVYGGGW